jgi:hypothetical protein
MVEGGRNGGRRRVEIVEEVGFRFSRLCASGGLAHCCEIVTESPSLSRMPHWNCADAAAAKAITNNSRCKHMRILIVLYIHRLWDQEAFLQKCSNAGCEVAL